MSRIVEILQNEKLFATLTFANVSLESVRRFILRFQPELTFMLTLVQIIVGVLTIIHIVKKWWKAYKKKNEAPPAPDSP
jgi:hypothetical protein